MINLTGTDGSTRMFYCIESSTILGIREMSYDSATYYEIIVYGHPYFLSVDAESYYKVKQLLALRGK